MVWHPLAALAAVPGLTQVVIIGFYEDAVMNPFIKEAKREFPNIGISYLREYKPLGTAGGLYHCECCFVYSEWSSSRMNGEGRRAGQC
jgi:mannose-1-phosphate guanylyltransferase